MEKENHLMGEADVNRLAKLYVEPTNRCNLDCRTCMRHGWEEELGFMEFGLFEKIVADRVLFPSGPPFFSAATANRWAIPASSTWWPWPRLGSEVELISNAIRLDEKMTSALPRPGSIASGCRSTAPRRRAMPTCAWATTCRRSSPTWSA